MTYLGVPNPPLPGANRKRPNNGIPFTHTAKNELRSTCKLCPEGVFTGDDTVWIRGRLIGLAHRPCAVRAGVTIVELQADAAPAPQPTPARQPADTLRSQTRGGYLTERQIAFVRLLADGLTPARIAAAEGVPHTYANNVLARARLRIGVADNAALVAAAREHGLIRDPGSKG